MLIADDAKKATLLASRTVIKSNNLEIKGSLQYSLKCFNIFLGGDELSLSCSNRGLETKASGTLLVLVAQCPTLCDPMDYSPPGSSVHGILQARMLEWVAISFSRACSRPKDQTWVSYIAGRFFTIWATREAHPSGGSYNFFSQLSWGYAEMTTIVNWEALKSCAHM